MMHKNRRYTACETSLDALCADFIRSPDWTLCTGFLVAYKGHQYLILNDSTSEGSLQEYAILRVVEHVDAQHWKAYQVESFTVSWMVTDPITKADRPLEYLREKFEEAFCSEFAMGSPATASVIKADHNGHPQGYYCHLCA